MNQYDYLFKFIMIGDTGVGKSCMLLRFVDDRFREDYDATIGVEFGSKIIDVANLAIKIQIWDTAGQESFRSITRSYYKGAIGAVVVFDITKRSSFDNLPKWLHDIKEQGKEETFVLIVGNKFDQMLQREVSQQEASEFAEQQGFNYVEVSAKSGDNVNKIFNIMAQEILSKIQQNLIDFTNESSGIKVGSKKTAPLNDYKNKQQNKDQNLLQKQKKDIENNGGDSQQEQQSYCQC
ncbi:Rab-family small GTPase (macronuclear) [Tetrahymena thermophila SB210]|uniref:Rab-family small GTPase n=2 Tax=Tetrahymena thermophila TaxID=5911 RepID=I7M9M2_TETTS|nr:Rab-family small GTPase [Tetrahymena thermophila SB210]EAS02106.2 Rab-family small GTPase [Tetrahymena thermophila SB210]BAJ21305.1 Rab-family small GTPase Rab2F [Tetrahymena thermophila]|eukprot:XP_001022351.2 Rab-family small GTPase [Tetrahymena thermophila SB210]